MVANDEKLADIVKRLKTPISDSPAVREAEKRVDASLERLTQALEAFRA